MVRDMLAVPPISIHAPRGGSDPEAASRFPAMSTYFNPRSPWGERRLHTGAGQGPWGFQSTLPVGGATPLRRWDRPPGAKISIHAPRGGSDSKDAQFYLRIFGEDVFF